MGSDLVARLRGSGAAQRSCSGSFNVPLRFGPTGLVVLFIAVLHGDALHASFPHRGRGLLQRQPAPHRLVHLTVQRGVQHTLQAEVTVLFLKT